MAKRSTFASLGVSLVARTAQWRKAIKGMQTSLRAFGDSVRRVARKVAMFGTALTALATGAVALMVKRSFEMLDALGKTADRIGISVNALRGLERAAERTGADVEMLRKGLTMMMRNVADAAQGIGEAKQALELLRLDAKKLMTLKPDEMFLRIAGALEKVRTRTAKIGIMADIFGMRAVKLLNLADQGEERIRGMLKTAERLYG
ncbi:MAG: hypothetical protein GTO41_28720, partial [Burkholderiales bacterium]|nr:hypothetical protein [Burkholderiales bacterium]